MTDELRDYDAEALAVWLTTVSRLKPPAKWPMFARSVAGHFRENQVTLADALELTRAWKRRTDGLTSDGTWVRDAYPAWSEERRVRLLGLLPPALASIAAQIAKGLVAPSREVAVHAEHHVND